MWDGRDETRSEFFQGTPVGTTRSGHKAKLGRKKIALLPLCSGKVALTDELMYVAGIPSFRLPRLTHWQKGLKHGNGRILRGEAREATKTTAFWPVRKTKSRSWGLTF